MSLDDPLDAFESQIAAEERAQSPITRFIPAIAQVIEALPAELLPAEIAGPLAGAKWFSKLAASVIGRERDARREILIDVLSSEIRWLKKRVSEITEDHARFVREQFPNLVLDALEKAELTRSPQRIVRIGRIVANAAFTGPARTPDTTEELSRIAMSLDDSDVRVLTELVRGQRVGFEPTLGSVPGELVNNYWRTGESATHELGASPRTLPHGRLSGVAIRLDIPEGELQSRCAKLQAYGLVVQVERNAMKIGPGIVPYAVLTRGFEFILASQSIAGGATAV